MHELTTCRCASKLALHLDQVTALVGNILPLVSSDDQGHLRSFLFLVCTRLEPPVRRRAYIQVCMSVRVSPCSGVCKCEHSDVCACVYNQMRVYVI